ncbi:MAG: hypothetical protein RL226_1566 [Bacteroidota bacterium]
MNRIALLLILLFPVSTFAAQLSQDATISVLTCEPGDELYSVFGHSAIRVYEPGVFDVVYNYGTFEFSDDFYLKFAQGKLNYKLSKSGFPDFNYEYLMTNRAVTEQVLNLNLEEKQKVVDLLEENYLPENRYYLYDFFFDNCATRIRDILQKALGDRMQFHSSFPADSISFRQMIQRYLGNMHWGDFGIDMALGMPCDAKMKVGENMFLPDGIFEEFATATLDGKPLVEQTNELLLSQEDLKMKPGMNQPLLLAIALALIAMLDALFHFTKRTQMVFIPRIIFLLFGIIGILVLLLWVATDHTTTANNLNLIWASPLYLYFMVGLRKVQKETGTFKKQAIRIYAVVLAILLLTGSFWPQEFHPTFYWLMLAPLFSLFRIGWARMK